MENDKIVLFQEKQIRRVWAEEQWYFSVIDVIGVLTDSKDPSDYWTTMKRREKQLPSFCRKFKFLALDGRQRPTDCTNTEGIFRIIMSIPSPKAEPFKLWLAQVGKERIEEIENPELGFERLKEIYKAKGYSDEWIETRIKSIGIRKELTDEWKVRGVKEGQEYSILTAEIAKATFGLNPSEHKALKGLERQNLRDHMTNLELIFTMLGEEVTKQFAVNDDAQGFEQNYSVAQKGGKAAGEARRNLEKRGAKVVSSENFLNQIQAAEKENILISTDKKDVE
jgi:DNA-damage-inducible protein D